MENIDQFYTACDNEDEDAIVDWIAENINPGTIMEFVQELDMDPTTITEGFEAYPSLLGMCLHDTPDKRLGKVEYNFTPSQTFALALCFLDNRVTSV